MLFAVYFGFDNAAGSATLTLRPVGTIDAYHDDITEVHEKHTQVDLIWDICGGGGVPGI